MIRLLITLFLNMSVFVAIPLYFSNNLETMTTLMVFINPLYLFLQSQILATNFNKAYINIIANIAFALGYLYYFTGELSMQFIIFYSVMTILGTRLGSNKRRIVELKKKIEEEKAQVKD